MSAGHTLLVAHGSPVLSVAGHTVLVAQGNSVLHMAGHDDVYTVPVAEIARRQSLSSHLFLV